MNTLRTTLVTLSLPLLLVACAQSSAPTEEGSASSSSVSSASIGVTSSVQSSAAMSEAASSADTTGEVDTGRVIRVTAEDWKFSPTTITVNKGEKVTLEIVGVSGRHGFAVPELGINQAVNPGETVTITLNTDTAGEFAFRCSIPCGPGHREMVGTIVIES